MDPRDAGAENVRSTDDRDAADMGLMLDKRSDSWPLAMPSGVSMVEMDGVEKKLGCDKSTKGGRATETSLSTSTNEGEEAGL